MSDELVTQQDFDDANEELAKILTDANVSLNPFELIMLRLDMIMDILISRRVISEPDLDLKWATFLNRHLNDAISFVHDQADTIERETND